MTDSPRYRARSLWLDLLPEPLTPRPSLPGDLDCDVAIVGAGFTGLWTAYYLKRHQADLRVVVLEAEIAGFGPSGRNGGWVSGGIAGIARVYERRSSRDAVLRAVRESYRAVDEIGKVVEREEIDCGYAKEGMLSVATSAPQQHRLEAMVDDQRRAGVPEEDLRLLTGAEADAQARVKGGLAATYAPHAARVDPARLARGLARACEGLGVTIFEGTRVHAVAPRALRCDAGTVRAESVIRATESYTTLLPGEARSYLPLYSLMIATEPLPEDVWEEIGWREGLLIGDRHHLFFYAQRTRDGRIAIGGRGAPYKLGRPIDERNERSAEVAERLRSAVRAHFPAAADARITHHWGGPLAVPRDWSMSVTFDRASGLGFAGGYVGHGVAATNISGRTLADLVLGRDTELVTLPWVGHRSRRWELEPLRYAASSAIVRTLASADRREDRSGRRALRTLLVKPFMPPAY
ncbi:MAG TPA: FAD-dependent oxidoreductase [Thermoleophilaceae bacterium]